eukprot:4630081-Prymnesium_polylepis.2
MVRDACRDLDRPRSRRGGSGLLGAVAGHILHAAYRFGRRDGELWRHVGAVRAPSTALHDQAGGGAARSLRGLAVHLHRRAVHRECGTARAWPG